jgi:hypothetical protein
MKKNKFPVPGMLAMMLIFGFVLSGCASAGSPATEVTVAEVSKEDEEYAFPKSISLSFSLPEKADGRITKAQYDEARGSGTEFYEYNNSDGTTGERFFSGEWRYWSWSGNGGEYGKHRYFEATNDQIAEVIQALSLPRGWTYRYEISGEKMPSIFITQPGGTEGKSSFYWLEPLNPMEYQYCDANGEWHGGGEYYIQVTTK